MTNKIITPDGLIKVRLALYNAKLCIESGFDGEDKRVTIRTIIEALDVTATLPSVPRT